MSDPSPTPTPQAPPAPPPPPAPVVIANNTPSEPETFSKEYVRELRGENKGWRLKAQEQENAAQAAKAAADQAKSEAEAKVAKAQNEATGRIIRAEMKAEALRAGIKSLDFIKLLDTSAVTLDDKGDLILPEKFFEKAKEAWPDLFGAPPPPASGTSSPHTPPSPNPPAQKHARDMTPSELREFERKHGLTG